MLRLTLGCLLLVLCSACASSSESGVYYPGLSIITLDNHYDITGSSIDELYQEMREKGPPSSGHRYYAEARWNIRWSFTTVMRMGQCELDDIEVPMTISITMPQWEPVDGDTTLLNQWQSFHESLFLHEEGHREIAMDSGREIIKTLKSMKAFSCDTLRDEANRKARELFENYNIRNRLYDKDTRHGINQGAVWPPRNG